MHVRAEPWCPLRCLCGCKARLHLVCAITMTPPADACRPSATRSAGLAAWLLLSSPGKARLSSGFLWRRPDVAKGACAVLRAFGLQYAAKLGTGSSSACLRTVMIGPGCDPAPTASSNLIWSDASPFWPRGRPAVVVSPADPARPGLSLCTSTGPGCDPAPAVHCASCFARNCSSTSWMSSSRGSSWCDPATPRNPLVAIDQGLPPDTASGLPTHDVCWRLRFYWRTCPPPRSDRPRESPEGGKSPTSLLAVLDLRVGGFVGDPWLFV